MSGDLFKSFGVNLPKLIDDNLGKALLPATLTKVVVGTRTDITGGTKPTEVPYTTRGFIDFQNQEFQNPTLAINGRKVVVLLGNPLPSGIFPEPGDRITIEGVEYHIPNDGEVDRDPASATYTCTVRET